MEKGNFIMPPKSAPPKKPMRRESVSGEVGLKADKKKDDDAQSGFKEFTYKLDPSVEQMSTHFEMEGNLLHNESEEGKKILAEKAAKEEARRRAAENESLGAGEGYHDDKPHRNQFNFSDRACQTAAPPMRDREIFTQPPPSISFGNTVTLCEVFDAYTEDLERQKIAKERAAVAAKVSKNVQKTEEVMCLDFHPTHASLLAVGCYDGTVMIYDIRSKTNKPLFQSTVKTGKHTDPVWQVMWQQEDLSKNPNFFRSKNELQHTDVMELKLAGIVSEEGEEHEEASLVGLAGGCCIDFNSKSEHLFVVGTEEGRIHKCSKAYNSQIHVFDLAENKHEPMCDQKVVRKSKLTHLAFNPKHPILIVGDDHGGVLCLKFSPNLRKTEAQKRAEAMKNEGAEQVKKPPPKKKGGGEAAEDDDKKKQVNPAELEMEKLEKILGISSVEPVKNAPPAAA
ncbi:hypothetical protein GUITHDRAFT_119182 [Guillardia theta CCMP2712]|uniref:Uncharacterized protein n=1 Tax=Guillardia theta (strain CCMP2712) TaxID=905079 RepID=L1IEW6_GUITC|nr:hypothetical protein GUITHDRAFT_119182 [Guillardia theta CCMP2712]EKX34637.1 hypothetical protein GUITHDRAFT_119182 [Guillardia theta CCMP2712]|eukprot:XP_005821617.1 hypothetical protein GUITHDRAFT_119182 [Guillardia theta CCMP2712]